MTLALDIPLNDTQFSAQRKSEVLVEALPWIRRFQGRTVVVKYGGKAVGDPRPPPAWPCSADPRPRPPRHKPGRWGRPPGPRHGVRVASFSQVC